MLRLIESLALAGILLAFAGCGEGKTPLSPAEQFKRKHAATVTPDGRIKTESVREVPGKRIRYPTENGSVFEVPFDQQADGTIQTGSPTRVKPGETGGPNM